MKSSLRHYDLYIEKLNVEKTRIENALRKVNEREKEVLSALNKNNENKEKLKNIALKNKTLTTNLILSITQLSYFNVKELEQELESISSQKKELIEQIYKYIQKEKYIKEKKNEKEIKIRKALEKKQEIKILDDYSVRTGKERGGNR